MNRKILLSVFIILLFSINGLLAQNFANGFNFYLLPDDSTSQLFLPAFPCRPIGDDAFVGIVNGHFAVKGERIRFFGANIVAEGAFPTPEIAAAVAGRLRKMGFNLVRFHHMDNPWSSSLFELGSDTRHLNPATLDRFEKLISELKRNGIYANINLHCSRTFRPADGIVDADSLLNFDKGVNLFDAKMIALQKEYARQLLTHVNPYTGLALVNDPVMAMVEIVNENSLYRAWRDNRLVPISEGGILTRYYQNELDSLWIDFLREKYTSNENLRQSWGSPDEATVHPNLIQDGGFENSAVNAYWQLEQHSPASGVMVIDGQYAYAGKRSMRVVVLQSDNVGWHLQFKYPKLSIQKDSLYTVTVAARADANRSIELVLLKDSSPWTYLGGERLELTTDWKVYRFSFKAPETYAADIRLSFNLGFETGSYWFDEVNFSQITIEGLRPDENLENGRVTRISYQQCLHFSEQRVRDMSEFYINLQNHFFDEMTAFLKNELGVKVPITGTNWNVGIADLAIQSRLDYLDNHAYWDHPSFPHEPWSSTDWQINNTPMVTNSDGGAIANLFGGVPFAGKPFTVSEYNHPFPNRYQSEGPLFISAYGGFHDIDGIMFFAYIGGYRNWSKDFIDGYFDIHRNTVMMALMPSCALTFRNGYITPSQNPLTVAYHRDDILMAPKNDLGYWSGYFPLTQQLALNHAFRISSFDAPAPFNPADYPKKDVTVPRITDTQEIIWDRDMLVVKSPRFVALSGYLQNHPDYPAGALTLIGAADNATLTWVALDDKPLEQARRSLLTVVSKIQNYAMQWDGTTTVHDHWGTSPTSIYPIAFYLNLKIDADSIQVFPLTETGAPRPTHQTILPDDFSRFRILLNQAMTPTVWFGLAAFGGKHSSASSEPAITAKSTLQRIYPNPFNNRTTIEFHLPNKSEVEIAIYDLAGRLVKSSRQIFSAGTNYFYWDGKNQNEQLVSSGVYLIALSYLNQHSYRKCIFLQ